MLEAPTFTIADMIDLERASGMRLGPFHQHWLRERAPEKVRRYLQLAREHPHIYGARQGLAAGDINDPPTAAFNARNTSASEIAMMGPTGAGANTADLITQYCQIGANDARAGKRYRLTFAGLYGNTGTPTIVLTPRWGQHVTIGTNVSLGASIAWTTITGTTALPFFGQFEFTVWTSPPGKDAGTGKGFGICVWGVPSGTIFPSVVMGGTLATIDTTGQGVAGCGLQMGITWSASSASNTSTLHDYFVQSLN